MKLQSRTARLGFFVGSVIAGTALGLLLALGIAEILALSEGVRVFRYEGY